MTAITLLFDDLCTGFTRSVVTDLLTEMLATVQLPLTNTRTLEDIYTAAFHGLTLFPTQTLAGDHSIAGWAGTRMTEDVAVVFTSRRAIFLAHFSAAVRSLHSVPFRVPTFSTKTAVLVGNLVSSVLTGRASPSIVGAFNSSCGRLGPRLDAAEVEDVKASVTAPHGILSSNRVTAHHTLVRACCQLLYQQGSLALVYFPRCCSEQRLFLLAVPLLLLLLVLIH